MGRKNRNVRRANGRREFTRLPKGLKPRTGAPRINIDRMITPDGKCGRKSIYRTEERAEAALTQVQQQRTWMGSGHVEQRVYHCARCNGWHLTSRKEYRP